MAEVLSSDAVCPCFGDLPLFKELPTTYYQFRFDGFPSPKRHWMFVGEIVDDSLSSYKQYDHKTVVADRRMLEKGSKGAGVPVCFYYEKDAPCTFKWSELKRGHTLCVMYAEKDILRVGSDSWEGVRVDALDYATVIPHPLRVVLQCAGADETCVACGKKPKQLMRCTQCKVVKFCDVACQRQAWPEHKNRCEGLKSMRDQVMSVVENVSGEWEDEYRPFRIVDKMPVHADFFGKGTVK